MRRASASGRMCGRGRRSIVVGGFEGGTAWVRRPPPKLDDLRRGVVSCACPPFGASDVDLGLILPCRGHHDVRPHHPPERSPRRPLPHRVRTRRRRDGNGPLSICRNWMYSGRNDAEISQRLGPARPEKPYGVSVLSVAVIAHLRRGQPLPKSPPSQDRSARSSSGMRAIVSEASLSAVAGGRPGVDSGPFSPLVAVS